VASYFKAVYSYMGPGFDSNGDPAEASGIASAEKCHPGSTQC